MASKRLGAGVIIVLCFLVYLFSLAILSQVPGWIHTTGPEVGEHYYPGDTPVLVLYPNYGGGMGTVVIAHGFAANIGMMKPMGYYLAQHGFTVVLFDFPGYGNSRLKVNETSMEDTLGGVCIRFGGENYSLVGHSMGSYAVLNYSMSGHGKAVIGLSSFYSDVNLTSPRNMLLIAGTGDMPSVVSSLPAAVANGTGVPDPKPGVLYGDFANGTAREYAFVEANHITVLFNRTAYEDLLDWLLAANGHSSAIAPGSGGMPLEWAFAAIGMALIAFLPGLYLLASFVREKDRSFTLSTNRSTGQLLLTGFAGCLLAAIAVNVCNLASFTGITMADKFIGFLLYAGVFTLAIDHFSGAVRIKGWSTGGAIKSILLALIAGALLIAAIAIPMNMSFYEQPTTPYRLLLMAVVALLTLPFFVATDAVVRGAEGIKSLASGVVFRAGALALVALAFVVAGNLFFDLVILPVIVPLFLLLEIVSYYAYRWTGSILAGAVINALITGWLLASAFPLA